MSTTGSVEFKYEGKVYQTWYKVFGDLNGSKKRPLVALHGGPGMTHHYMATHAVLYEKAGIPVVVYDEIGNGQSSHALDEPKEFWKPEVFMDQLDSLLNHLGISSDFDLLGHSWGGMLASTYTTARTPHGLKRLIIIDSPANVVLLEQEANALFERNFPEEMVKQLKVLRETDRLESEEYKKIALEFSKKHICAMDRWPPELLESVQCLENNRNVRNTMMGVSTLNITGNLKNWSIIDELHKIRVPLLLISSPNDVVQEAAIIPYFLYAPKVKWVEIPTTTHSPMFEDPERYFGAILAFLESVH